MGGTNDLDNLVELTIEQHAAAHKSLYEQHGKIQDKVAYMGLLKLIDGAECVRLIQSETKKGRLNPMYGKPAPNRGVKRPGVGGRKKGTTWTQQERDQKMQQRQTKEYKEKMSKVYSDPARNKKISEARKGHKGAATGKCWFTNGVEERYFAPGTQPKGFYRGRLDKKHTGS